MDQKTRKPYLELIKKPNNDNKPVIEREYMVLNRKKDFLGDIAYRTQWKRWCFYPEASYVGKLFFDSKCLKEIVLELERLDNDTKRDVLGSTEQIIT